MPLHVYIFECMPESPSNRPFIRHPAFAGLMLCAAAARPVRAQTASTEPLTVSGSVVDAVSQQPVFRALVKLGQRAVLTDQQGHFSFAAVDTSSLGLSAQKPGYSFGETPEDSGDIQLKPETANDPVRLVLYPEALVKGTVTNPDGDPVANIGINAKRELSTGTGHRWVTTNVTRTNARGQFRLPLPAGNYVITSQFSRVGSKATLPYSLPQATGRSSKAGMHIGSGDQLGLDLHPSVATLLEVKARLDGTDMRDVSLLTAIGGDGTRFPVPFHPNDDGSVSLSVPAGRYTIEVRGRGRGDESFSQAMVNLTADAAQPIAVDLHFAPSPTLPVEVSIDDAALAAASTSNTALALPNARSLGISLEASGDTSQSNDMPRLVQDHSGNSSFAVPAGSYRLRARSRGWYIVSATSGGTDILGHDLLVGAGTGATPIQLVVSNQVASVGGSVTLNGKPAACWVFLVAATPAAIPMLTLRSGDDGSFAEAFVPPGTYRAVAFEHRHTIDPDDGDALNSFSTHVVNVTVKPGDKLNTVQLEAVADAELKP